MNKSLAFEPDYTNILSVLENKRPARLPLYEHTIDTAFISKFLNEDLNQWQGSPQDIEAYYRKAIKFWKDMTYDAFAFEAGICTIYPDHGAILGGKLGPIQTRDDFDKFPWDDLPKLFWERYTPHFESIAKVLPKGMKAYGGCGYGIFESAQDLVGYESLCLMQYLDPELFTDLFKKIGDLYVRLWSDVAKKYSDMFVFFRMGDDLGFKTSTLLEPDTIRTHILPQYKRVINTVHNAGKKFLLHSCGNIFDVMDDIIELGINAKHSNEDEIAPFDKWIELYSDRIGLFGGVDVNILSLNEYDEVYRIVTEKAMNYRAMANGYGLGSGNSIADYVPTESYQAMIDAVADFRRSEVI